jgi:hypothetical protein
VDEADSTLLVSMIKAGNLHRKWMRGGRYQTAFEAPEAEFSLASAMIEARSTG